MTHFRELNKAVKVYVCGVVIVGTAALTGSLYALYTRPVGLEWLILAGLTILTGSFTVKISSINAYISVSETFVFTTVLLFGAPAGTITVLLECLVILLWMRPQGRPWHRVLFNLAAPSVALWLSANAFFWLSRLPLLSQAATPLPELFLPLAGFTASYFFLNSGLVAIAVGLETHRSPARIWWGNFAWLSVNYFSGASLAAVIVTYTRNIDLSTLAVIIPLLLVSYLTFRIAMGRAEDSYAHLSQLNRLYISTIETLAMAIDAKDQITHGHIRRVQTYAVGLARHLGVSDERLLKAIEAAALLHDMGKLAVPEYILNKPGKLTPGEFEKMKLHASVGADILSAIDFPYPVVPIVRHHHENWDGTGYPTGLHGTDIPIGARILSVVDCFDALTSDRPYRPKLTDEAAISILMSRRGSMYDPLVVDTFIRVYKSIRPEGEHTSHSRALAEISSSTSRDSSREYRDEAYAGRHERDAPALHAAIQSATDVASIGDVISFDLKRLLYFDVSILYVYDQDAAYLVPRHISGDTRHALHPGRIQLGHGLSGWVAVNRVHIANSDSFLDLGDGAAAVTPPLRYALSVPLAIDDNLIGVLTLHSRSQFCTSDEWLTESIAPALAARLATLLPVHQVDAVTGLKLFDTSVDCAASIQRADNCVMHIEVFELDSARRCHEDRCSLLAYSATQLRHALPSDVALLRDTGGDFVALVPNGRRSQLVELSRKVRAHFDAHPFVTDQGRAARIGIGTVVFGDVYADARRPQIGLLP